jgi:hypothetical protein
MPKEKPHLSWVGAVNVGTAPDVPTGSKTVCSVAVETFCRWAEAMPPKKLKPLTGSKFGPKKALPSVVTEEANRAEGIQFSALVPTPLPYGK